VRIRTEVVGICGSDVHYYTHGRIGPFVVNAPMVLGHEATGTVAETGSKVTSLAVGDRVCVEPGVPDFSSRATLLGLYNLDPSLTFWATPPVHGCLTPDVVHPAALSFKLPDNVSFAEGAMVEPLAVGMQAAVKAKIQPGMRALVLGAGPIGILVALTALAGGCAEVLIVDPLEAKLDVAEHYNGITALRTKNGPVIEQVRRKTSGWGVDIVFDARALARPIGRSPASSAPAARSCSSVCRSRPFSSTSSLCRRRKSASKPCSAMPTSMIARSHSWPAARSM
jgi:D-xylulose reductase